jgi:hypothetical protein
MNACHEPLSWLRLEHYHLGELPQEEHSSVQAHLDGCPHCRAMLAEIEDDARTLPPLPLPDPTPTQPWYRRLSILLPSVAGPVLVAALALVILLPPTDDTQLPGHRVTIKGGELLIALVRERAGVTQDNPSAYRDGDRFQVQLSTPPGDHRFDLVVLQDGQAFFPLEPGALPGGNRQVVGAFELSGPGDAAVCAMVDEGRVSRAQLEAQGAEALEESAACVTLEHSPGGRP